MPVLAAVSLMASNDEPTPRSLVMMGGPIDARRSPTQVNDLATENGIEWFQNNLIHTVPFPYPGHGRRVYPGFLQHAGFLSMNPNRHVMSHWDFYTDLVKGDLQDAQAHRQFYDEYNAVLDMPAEYYLDTIRVVFQEFLLPQGKWKVHGQLVTPSAIRNTALLSIEGELDDIAGLGRPRRCTTCAPASTPRIVAIWWWKAPVTTASSADVVGAKWCTRRYANSSPATTRTRSAAVTRPP